MGFMNGHPFGGLLLGITRPSYQVLLIESVLSIVKKVHLQNAYGHRLGVLRMSKVLEQSIKIS